MVDTYNDDYYSGRPQYNLRFHVTTAETDSANNRSRYSYHLYMTSLSGYGSYTYNSSTANIRIGGYTRSFNVPDMLFGPGSNDYTGKIISIASGTSSWIYHDGNGNASFIIDTYHNAPSPFGTANPNDKRVYANRIPRRPGRAGRPEAYDTTWGGSSLRWSAASRGHASITGYQITVSEHSDFSSPAFNQWEDSNTVEWIPDLKAGTKYYARVRARNGDGTGSWSPTGTFWTTPSKPTNLDASSFTLDSADLSWSAAGGTVSSYSLYVSTNSDMSSPVFSENVGTSLTKTVTGLNVGQKYYARVRANNSSGPGEYSSTISFNMPPSRPTSVSTTNPTPTTIDASWSVAGGKVDSYHVMVNAGGTTVYDQNVGNVTSVHITSLAPGTEYKIAVRGVNESGAGQPSSAVTFYTLPSSPPTIVASPDPDGDSATITVSPPGSVINVDSYTIEYRVAGTTQALSVSTTTSVTEVVGLSPGETYEWRASATIGGYTSPWSGWVTASQPSPNTSPGDYFDGSTTDTPVLDYTWDGTPNLSSSTIVANNVDQWVASSSVGGTPRIYQSLGAVAGTYSATVLMLSNATAPGVSAGMDQLGLADVIQQTEYTASIYVRASRPQRVSLDIYWYDSGGGSVGSTLGVEQVVGGSTTSERLVTVGTAPVGAVQAGLFVSDKAGTGWSAWQMGETFTIDAAAITLGLYDYFDGDTQDTARYKYSWIGTPNASISQRERIAQEAIDLLDDPDCPSPPLPPAPPAIPAQCIQEVGSWLRYTIPVPEQTIRLWSTSIPLLILKTGTLPEQQIRIRYFDNPDNESPSDVYADSDWIAEQIISHIPANTVMTLDGITKRVFASVNGGDEIAGDKLLYGTGGAPATWAELKCGSEHIIAIDVPADSIVGNLSVDISLTQRM